jgi:hypothetical protein
MVPVDEHRDLARRREARCLGLHQFMLSLHDERDGCHGGRNRRDLCTHMLEKRTRSTIQNGLALRV